ncbi:MAG TPA: sigma-70 family RNA polymerase sigma factor [Steroidobacteraceae bacterium]
MLRMAESVDSDEGLMLRFAAGDVRAFETLYRRHEMKVWRYIYRSVSDQGAADDLMQDVWFAVSQAARRYQPSARFTTWVFTLAHHRIVDRHRRARVLQSLDVATDDRGPWVERLAAEANANPQTQTESAQTGVAVLAAVSALPREQRDTFLLQAEGDLSVEEIATATGVSFETAKSRLRYARNRLKQVLQEQL